MQAPSSWLPFFGASWLRDRNYKDVCLGLRRFLYPKASHFPCCTKALRSVKQKHEDKPKRNTLSHISILKSSWNWDTRLLDHVSVFQCLGQLAGIQKVCPFPFVILLFCTVSRTFCCVDLILHQQMRKKKAKSTWSLKTNNHAHIFLQPYDPSFTCWAVDSKSVTFSDVQEHFRLRYRFQNNI